MLTKNETLKNPEIEEFLKANQNSRSEIETAADILEGQPDAEKALKKLLPSLASKEIRVFFSYKKKDEETAKAIVGLLRKWSADKLKITYQYEFGDEIVGKKWRDKIHQEINQANWFILLLPDPRDDWDWCLYETGLFEAQVTSADRLICLHHPDTEIPSPIEGYQSVTATQDEVEKFLKMIFTHENPIAGLGPVNKAIENEIPALAGDIVNAIRTPLQLVREIYEPWIELIIDNPGQLKNKSELDQAIVKEANQRALNLFRLLRKKPTWGEFWRSLPGSDNGDDQWREDLFRVIRKIGNDHQFYPVQSVFRNAEGKMFRPVVCAVDRDRKEGAIKIIHITFTEDVVAVDRSSMPRDLSMLANTLRSTFRFRWEVLEKYGHAPITEDDVECLETALLRIRHDWESRNIGSEMDILALFPEKAQEGRLIEMLAQWHKVRNDEKTGELDIAIRDKDTEKIPLILNRFLPVNQEFLEMAAERFASIISEKSEPPRMIYAVR
jgi:hypothetical protein